jgi:REP element-mobilizing transposase RayT
MMHTSLHSGIQNYVVLHCSYFLYWCSVDELQRLLKDKEAYNDFFNSLDQVKTQNNVSIVAASTMGYCVADSTVV